MTKNALSTFWDLALDALFTLVVSNRKWALSTTEILAIFTAVYQTIGKGSE